MVKRHKIHIDSDNLGAPETDAQKKRDEEIRNTGIVPEETLRESPEEADVVAESEAERVLSDDMKELQSRCEEWQEKYEGVHDQLLRSMADFSNYRRRAREELEQARQFAVEDFASLLLPVMDNFERAIQSAEETEIYDALHGGVILILRQLRDVLEKEGVKPIDAEGKMFDPNYHEAVMRVDTDEYPDNTVIEELQKGYTLGGKVIRPSMVRVAKHT